MEVQEAAEEYFYSTYKIDAHPISEDVKRSFIAGAEWSRDIYTKRYEKFIGFINLLNHSVLEPSQHEILDDILKYTGLSVEELRRIALVYPSEELLSNSLLSID